MKSANWMCLLCRYQLLDGEILRKRVEKRIITYYYVQSLQLHALNYQFIDQIEEIIIKIIDVIK